MDFWKSVSGGGLFLVPSLEVPDIPLTLCHSSLIDMEVPLNELEKHKRFVQLSFIDVNGVDIMLK